MSNAAPPPAPANRTNTQDATTAARRRPNMLYQPLVLLTGLVTNVVFLVAYGLYTYHPVQSCFVGPLCQFKDFSPWLQVGLILLTYAVMWLLLFFFAARALEETSRRGNSLVETIRALSRFQTIRPLLLVYGLLLLACLIVVWLFSGLSVPLITVVVVTAGVCFWGSRGRAVRPLTDPYGALGGPDYQARRLAPLRWFRPNPRPPLEPTGGQIGNTTPRRRGTGPEVSTPANAGRSGNTRGRPTLPNP